jgi:dinuclear metal center YbgI/SA1388 family protein
MTKRNDLIKFIMDFFGAEEIQKAQKLDTHGANGLQIKGNSNVTGIALGVSADLEFFQKAVREDLNFLIVHHGLRLTDVNFAINEILKSRLKFLFDNNLTLTGFHYILDSHRKIGHNAVVLNQLGAKIVKPFYEDWGWIGELKHEMIRSDIIERCTKIYACTPISFLYGKKEIKTIAVVSGAGFIHPYTDISTQIMEGIDLYITGVPTDTTEETCREGKINYLAYGHYNTEVIGIKALGEIIKKAFPGLPIKFIEIPNKL